MKLVSVSMPRPTSELRSEVRLEVVRLALSGQVLSPWWAPNWSSARSSAVSVGGGWHDSDWHGERKADGVHVWIGRRYSGPKPDLNEKNFEDRVRPPDVVMPWSEVREIVLAGATQDRRAAYTKAYGEYCEHATTPLPKPYLRPGQRKELGLPPDDGKTHPENEAHHAEGLRIHIELRTAGFDILQAGCGLVTEKEAKQPVQMGLW